MIHNYNSFSCAAELFQTTIGLCCRWATAAAATCDHWLLQLSTTHVRWRWQREQWKTSSIREWRKCQGQPSPPVSWRRQETSAAQLHQTSMVIIRCMRCRRHASDQQPCLTMSDFSLTWECTALTSNSTAAEVRQPQTTSIHSFIHSG